MAYPGMLYGIEESLPVSSSAEGSSQWEWPALNSFIFWHSMIIPGHQHLQQLLPLCLVDYQVGTIHHQSWAPFSFINRESDYMGLAVLSVSTAPRHNFFQVLHMRAFVHACSWVYRLPYPGVTCMDNASIIDLTVRICLYLSYKPWWLKWSIIPQSYPPPSYVMWLCCQSTSCIQWEGGGRNQPFCWRKSTESQGLGWV